MNRKILFLFALFQLWFGPVSAQNNTLKSEAIKEMQSGRYGEAIDLLNRYISTYPQEAEGYNLRGQCFEKRAQYEMSVYDFRSAKKIKPNDKEINLNLSRSTGAWYKLLYNKIEGHKREIALYAKSPINYLEIGKCYKNLGEWITAEEWYDKYIKMEEASADEVIRYTEILAQNKHSSKGVPILKKYTEKYPRDHRIWSRYGYFTLWEGKIKIAKEAFEKALALRPYFKEAMDGLDQANGKGYVYTINDTSYNSNKRGSVSKEYPIDKYYKIIKVHPEDIESRYALFDELVKNNRMEEAYQQLSYLQEKGEDSTTKFQEKSDYFTSLRDSVYKQDLIVYNEKFDKNNKDKETVIKLSDIYAHLYDYDNAILVLETYLSNFKEDEELDLRYVLTKYCAWTYQWNKAFIQCNILLKQEPDNKNYQLLMARLIAWNIIDAKPEEVDKAENYLLAALKDDPRNIQAILSLAFLYSGIEKFPESKNYIELARSIDPNMKELISVENTYNTRLSLLEEKKILRLRAVAGKLAEEGNCKGAYETYNEIMSTLENPENSILIEYASFCTCANDFKNAVKTYDKILENEFDINIAALRDINVMWGGDTLKAIDEFLALKEKEPYNYSVNFYLGDIYERISQPVKARDLYQSLIEAAQNDSTLLDSTQIAGFKTRLEYLNASHTSDYFSLFDYIGIAPTSVYYSDNLQFSYNNYGVRGDISLFEGLSIGSAYFRHQLNSSINSLGFFKNLSTIKGYLSFKKGYFFAATGLGVTETNSNIKTGAYEFTVRFEKPKEYSIDFNYEKNDARVILFSPNIINFLMYASISRLSGYYYLSDKGFVSSYFRYINISDGNAGNEFQLKAGKYAIPEMKIGYEYYYSNYSFSPEYFFNGKKVPYYYAPKKLETHSVWGDYMPFATDEINISIGGKLGYVPANDFIVKEIYFEALYHPFRTLSLSGKVTAGNSSRDNAVYSYLSGYLTAYLSIF